MNTFILPPAVLLAAGVVLCILLYLLVMRRLDEEGARYHREGLRSPSKPVHSSLFKKVEHVRHDFASPQSAQTPPARRSRRMMLIAAARGAIRGLSFFRTRDHEHGT